MLDPQSQLLLRSLLSIVRPVAGLLFKKIQAGTKPAELEVAIKAGLTAAVEQENKLETHQRLFYKSQPDSLRGVPGFLSNFFDNERVQNELTQPFNEKKWISVSNLVHEFKHSAQRYQQVNPLEDRIEPWLKAFIEDYFQKTPAYYNFENVKNQYFQQLRTRYGKVRFGGIAVSAKEIDNPEELVNIFVVPDIAAQKSASWSGSLSDRLENLSADKLLSVSKSQKLVLLGAPGSGKTSLLDYLAVQITSQKGQDLGIDSETDWLPIMIKIPDLAR